MRKLYNIRLKTPITITDIEKAGFHATWAATINNSELYAAKSLNGTNVEIFFKRRHTICNFDFSKEFAKIHFEIVCPAVNDEGKEISRFINQSKDYN